MASCSSSSETATPASDASPTPTPKVSSSATDSSPEDDRQLPDGDGGLTESSCAGECGDGFRLGDVDYLLSCGRLDLETYRVADSVRGNGRVAWSDEPIEVREIVDWSPTEFVAVSIDGDICQDDPGQDWYVASASDISDWAAFCGLLGGVLTADTTCDEP